MSAKANLPFASVVTVQSRPPEGEWSLTTASATGLPEPSLSTPFHDAAETATAIGATSGTTPKHRIQLRFPGPINIVRNYNGTDFLSRTGSCRLPREPALTLPKGHLALAGVGGAPPRQPPRRRRYIFSSTSATTKAPPEPW